MSRKAVATPMKMVVKDDFSGEENDDSVDEQIAAMVPTPHKLSHLFADNDSDDHDEYEDAYEKYEYPGKYDVVVVEDAKWRHAKAKDRVTTDMAINELAQVVGDKNARDIRRRGHFMSPKAFEKWQEKYDPKKRYWADAMNLDNYGDPEFVVGKYKTKRGAKGKVEIVTDAEGNPIKGDYVAVNGWTTARSDYPLRKEYYENFPTHEERKENKYKPWIRSKYIIPDNLDDFQFPSHKYLEDRANKMATSKYDWRMPTFSARSEFMKMVIWSAYHTARDRLIEKTNKDAKTIKDKCDETYGHGWVVKAGGIFYNEWILVPFMKKLAQSQYYAREMQKYASRFRIDGQVVEFDPENDDHIERFEKVLQKKDTVRMSLNKEVRECLSNDEELKKAILFVANVFLSKMGKAVDVKVHKGSPTRKALNVRK